MRSMVTLTAALLVSLTAAGCTSSGHPAGNSTSHPADRSSAASASASQAPSAKALPPGVVGATRVPTKVANKPALRADVRLASCSPRAHGWRASGTVHNPHSAARSYKITVFFTADNATVIGFAATTVHVLGRGSRPWTASATFHAPKPTLCVLRGVG